MEAIHTPVLKEEITQYLAPPAKDSFMIDATLGEGGHSEAFLERFPSLCVAGVDIDDSIQNRARERLAPFGNRMRFFRCWAGDFFNDYPAELPRPDIILFDLGISLYHYYSSNRGFSFLTDQYLDMRLDVSGGRTAAELIAALSQNDLADLLFQNAGERYSRRIAAAIKRNAPVTTTGHLAEIVASSVPHTYRRGPIHPATKTFQALRMAVNAEAERLPAMLEAALRVLKTGGRMGVISFHSGEDRVVKNFFRDRSRDFSCPPETPMFRSEGNRAVLILTRKPVTAGEEECRSNPPSRSAKFRAVEKLLDIGVSV